jgi:predicted nuclease of predicted toxin-antitoxin system
MRWLVDECVDAALVDLLHAAGHDVICMSDVEPRASDAHVMDRAQREGRLLLTEDKDFGDLVFRQALLVPGIVLLRIDPARRSLKPARLRAAVEQLGDALLGRYTVIEESRLRSRQLRPSA